MGHRRQPDPLAVLVAFDAGPDLVTPVVGGAIQGAIYGLLGLGLVLLYKGSRIFNFAQAEFGSVAALCCLGGIQGSKFLPEMPYLVAALFGLVTGTAVALATERFVIRPLFHQPRVTILVATAGVTLLLIAFQLFFQGPNPVGLRPAIAGDFVNSGGLRITNQQVLSLAVLAVLAVLCALFFSRTRTGLAVLAVSQEPTATSLVGISVNRISMLTWGMAGFLGATAGLLLGGGSTVAPGFMTSTALIPAFVAAVFGGITALPGAFIGGIVIGVAERLAVVHLQFEQVPGLDAVVVFGLLLVVLLVRPAGLLGKEV
jgi:branched-chain amino acid transport system permease protein